MDVLNTFSLEGKVALVTGGAGLYGRQIVSALAEAGAKTYIASRGVEALRKVALEECEAGHDVTALKVDLSDERSIKDLHDEIINRERRMDVLVNNAVTRCACVGWDNSMDVFNDSLRVNASALFVITRLFGEGMTERGSGSIINIGSIMGMTGVEMSNYAGTNMGLNQSPIYHYEKGGMINFTRWTASMLGASGVRVNCVSAGGFQTDDQHKAFVKQYSERTQLGRMANNTDLKGIIVFLASDASQYITGTNIPVDGGYTAK